MQNKILWLAIVLFIPIGILQCAPIPDDEHFDETGEVRSSIVGEVTVHESCKSPALADDREGALIKGSRYGRIISRSNAYRECLARAMAFEMDFPASHPTGPIIGPYYPHGSGPCCAAYCTNPSGPFGNLCPEYPYVDSDGEIHQGGCICDPIAMESLDRQTARVLSAAASRNPMEHRCMQCEDGGTCVDERCPNGDVCVETLGDSGARAFTSAASNTGDLEVFKWLFLSPTWYPAISGVTWHESMHHHGYHHDADNSGLPPGVFDGAWGPHRMVDYCMQEVIARSESPSWGDCDLESAACSLDELNVIRTYAGTSGDCECVPDVFNYDQFSHPNNENETSDFFGHATAVGDFNNDGYEDLAVGAYGEDGETGVVYVFKGTPTVLQFWKRIEPSTVFVRDYNPTLQTFYLLPDDSRFGFSLASGDFNSDGYEDLAIGAPHYSYHFSKKTGYVVVLPGSDTGPDPTDAQGLNQSNLAENEDGDEFGISLESGDFDGDGDDDLAVGAYGDFVREYRSGAVFIFRQYTLERAPYGVPRLWPWAMIHQAMGPWENEEGDDFGFSLAAGSIEDNDSADELVIGAPGEDSSEGAIFIAQYNGTHWELTHSYNNTAAPGTETRFGHSLVIGNLFGGSPIVDLAVGAPAESSNTGAVHLFFGGINTGATFTRHIPGGPGATRFGHSLAAGRLNNDTVDDLVVGAPFTTDGSSTTGSSVFYTGNATDQVYWTTRYQTSFYSISPTDTVLYSEDPYGNFGFSVVTGDFNANGFDDAVIGDPGDSPQLPGLERSSGAVFVFREFTLGDSVKLDQVTSRFGEFFFDVHDR